MNSDFCVAVHALVYLNRRGCVLSSEELARNICTNPARVRKVLARMKKDGLVETKEGSSGGGYRFAKGAGEVSLAQVARALAAGLNFFPISISKAQPSRRRRPPSPCCMLPMPRRGRWLSRSAAGLAA